jgi:hypothetical protein
MLSLLQCTHEDDIRLSVKHFAVQGDQFLQLLFVFDPSNCAGLQTLAERKPLLSQSPTGKSSGVRSGDYRGQEVDPPRPTHRLGGCLFKNVLFSLWTCGGAP